MVISSIYNDYKKQGAFKGLVGHIATLTLSTLFIFIVGLTFFINNEVANIKEDAVQQVGTELDTFDFYYFMDVKNSHMYRRRGVDYSNVKINGVMVDGIAAPETINILDFQLNIDITDKYWAYRTVFIDLDLEPEYNGTGLYLNTRDTLPLFALMMLFIALANFVFIITKIFFDFKRNKEIDINPKGREK